MKKPRRPKVQRLELRLEELEAILARAEKAPLSPDDLAKLRAMGETLALLTRELEAKGASIERLKRLLFGPRTEKTSRVLGQAPADPAEGTDPPADPEGAQADLQAKAKRKGHGRNGAAAYRGAQRVGTPHPSLQVGALCSTCAQGKVYAQKPATLVRVRGMAPLAATVHELERLRCGLCGQVYTAPAPEGVGEAKYDETVPAMIGVLKYGGGLPFNRLERLQRGLGIPLPAATQWELVAGAEGLIAPAYGELIRQAAQGDVLYQDDTAMRILSITREEVREAISGPKGEQRKGVFTSGIVSTSEGHRIALFFTGIRHAGENLTQLLAQREAELPPPIQMCDALAVNTAGEFDTLLANCIAHARRRFVDVANHFPEEVRYVLETLRDVYANDHVARQQKMSPDQRLRFHQAESRPLMDKLEAWLKAQIDEHRVEPNSGLGQAIAYMLNHWPKLTLFLREPGAPLDNNLCERALKKAILHRKNAMFYKTSNGARVGDTFMSLIHTAELCGGDPFDYLVQLQRHHRQVAHSPAGWMPWNYRETLARASARADPQP